MTLVHESYVRVLRKMISVSERLGLIPQRNLVSDIVLDELQPYAIENGGHVTVERVEFVAGRGNVAIKTKVVCVLIAAEENSEIPGVGIEKLMESGKLDLIKNGPVIWVDFSDSQPCIGTAGVIFWTLKATAKLFHSGLPHLGINSIELGMDVLCKIQERFYTDLVRSRKKKNTITRVHRR
ncbi:hypothetical protein PsorP6_018215 [Peronosclerospora sorghi]|uniref:Uncharacterized protein n=1 Tax=Peronosclerospora sorghi TaxID=230839 RepID=A0ACC0WDF7_9STRA|nr:hypothetical protein PsorP6_018215 [Peronosclerospora sorghi]